MAKLLNFDEKEYSNSKEVIIQARPIAEKVAEEIHNQGYSNIFFSSVGGSLAPMISLAEMSKELSNISVHLEQAAELVTKGNKNISKDSVIITMSKSGDTKETVDLINWAHAQNVRIVGITKNEDSPVGKLSTWFIPMRHENGVEYEYMMLFWLYFKLLNLHGDFKDYEEFAEQLEKLPDNLLKAKQKFEPRANEIAKKYHDVPYQLWVGGSEMWGEVYLFSMCILEEMQWQRTKSVTSAEFFHGTLELLDETVPLFLIKGEGKGRKLDERVENFAKNVTDNLVVIDSKDFILENIDDKFRWIMAPCIISTILVDRLAEHFEKYTGHDLDIRRYYRKVEY